MPEAKVIMEQPDFSNIFASAALTGEIINWPSEDYLRGWGYLQSQEAPPMEYFNAFFNLADKKSDYLFNAINIRKSSTAYVVDDIVTSPNLSSQFWLVCTQAGTTDANEPDYSEVIGNQEITDGTAKFLVTPRIAKGIAVSDTEPDNPRDNDVWMQTSGNEKVVKLKRRLDGNWVQVFAELILSAISDSPIKSLERSKAYVVGDICAEVTLPKGGFLICTTAGTTAASTPSGYAGAAEGATITDGTAGFKVRYLDQIASLVSPAFTGIPTAPTASKGTDTNQIATMAALIAALADYAKLNSPAFTGTPTGPTAEANTNNTQLATTAFVKAALETIDLSDYATKAELKSKANIASPALIGTPTAPTPDSTTNNTQIATTAFVKALVGAANNGGIVSANLAQNGYVKFANGFILQWGRLSTNNTGNVTFPLSFSSFCAIALSTQSAYTSGAALSWNTYWTLNLDGFTCAPYHATYNVGKFYIAVGK